MFSAIFLISFAWMWNRNDKAKKNLRRITLTDGVDEVLFAEWRDHTRKRMSRADLAALLLTAMPLAAFVPFGIHACAWPALFLAFRSNHAGRKSDNLAKQIGFKRGVKWLASKKTSPHPTIPSALGDSANTILPAQLAPHTEMKTNEFDVVIPEGRELGDGYIQMPHNTRYSLLLKNHRRVCCDADVVIDGTHIGTWRIDASGEIRIERPVHDTGHFTYFEVGSNEARSAGISKNPDNGLISVTFKPEQIQAPACLKSSEDSRRDLSSGATGLTGESQQRFTTAAPISHDRDRIFTIHLRLVSKKSDIRPLAPRSTPVPPPVS